MPRIVRVAAVQSEPVWMDLDATADKTIALIRDAASKGAQLIAFPELWLPGYPFMLWCYTPDEAAPYVARYRANSPAVGSEHISRVRDVARELGISVVLGYSESDAGQLYIAQSLIDQEGEIVLHRRKLKPTGAEQLLFGEGDTSDLEVVETPLGRIGALNCGENHQPLSKFALFAQHEEIHVASWPAGIAPFDGALSGAAGAAATKVLALEGATFAIAATQMMTPEGAMAFPSADGGPCAMYGRPGGFARIYGPDSVEIVPPLSEDADGLLIADLDLDAIAPAQSIYHTVGHYARPDVVQLVHHRSSSRSAVGSSDTLQEA